MRNSSYLSPGKLLFILIAGLVAGTLMFKVVLADNLKDIIKDFPTNKAIAGTGLVYVILYSIWASKQDKKDELENEQQLDSIEYKQQLESFLELLRQSEKKK